jgi:single-strand DNA-binding protein
MKNSVQLIGHVGQDPEVKSLEGGKKLANISIATNEVYYKENGDKVEKTEWHRVTAWGKTAEIIEKYVTKGKEIAIEGKLTHRSYDDKDGVKRFITEVVANEILLLGKQ